MQPTRGEGTAQLCPPLLPLGGPVSVLGSTATPEGTERDNPAALFEILRVHEGKR